MRQEIPIVVLGADGRPAAGASVYVRTDPGGADATIYQAKTGGATHGNPRTSDAQGRVEGWLERNDYAATITVPGLPPWVEYFPIVSAADGAIDDLWLPTDLIIARHIAALAVGTAELADDAVNAAKIAALAVGTAELQDKAVTLAKRGDVSPWFRMSATGAAWGFAGPYTHYDLTTYGPAEYRKNGDTVEFRGAIKRTSGVPISGEGCLQVLAPTDPLVTPWGPWSSPIVVNAVTGAEAGFIGWFYNVGLSGVVSFGSSGTGTISNMLVMDHFRIQTGAKSA